MHRREGARAFGGLLALGLLAAAGAPAAGAAAYPVKPIEMTVLFGPGSGADLLARKVAEIAGKDLGQPILVVNRTGAGGAIGYNYLRTQAPDGYAIVWNSNSINTAYHAGNMNFDYMAFRGVAQLTTEPVSLAVKMDSPWKDIGALVDHARKNPGKLRVGNSGRGSFTHLTAVALENKTDIKLTHVPFGQGLAVAAMLGDKIEATVQLPAEIMAQVEGRQVRNLAITGEERLASLPDVPTFKEKGIGLTLSLWRGIAVHKDTSPAVIGRLEQAFKAAAESPEFKQFAGKLGATIEFRGAAVFDQFIAQQDKELAALMEQIGLKKQ
jgi:tripartite-type tricarboxylate transporter receptor subunit TctC